MPPGGLRTHVTVRGGLALPETLGFESTDTMSGPGPAALAVGDFVPVAEVDEADPDVGIAPAEVTLDGPVILLSNRPVTGGYPVIGVVREADEDRAAQLRPGQPVHFHWATGPQGRSTPAR